MIQLRNINYTRSCIFFFNYTATTEIYTLSLHDALPICRSPSSAIWTRFRSEPRPGRATRSRARRKRAVRSEEHTSELQSPCNLVCRLLLEKKQIFQIAESEIKLFPKYSGHMRVVMLLVF